MDLAALPVLSLADDPQRFSDEIGASFRQFGFAMVKDHGLDPDLVASAWRLTEEFFALPEAEKRSYILSGKGGARGYTAFGTEIAKGAKISDLKEFWHVGRELPAGHPLASDSMPPNVWPSRPEGFRETFEPLFAAFDAAGATILSRIAIHLGLAANWFDPAIEDGNSVLRLLHYPPIPGDAHGAIRAGAHEDINLITLLLGAEEAGLELLTREGNWISVSPPPGALVVNIGDMLQRLTNHVLPSTTHRVRNPDSERSRYSRYSMPFFLHLRSDFPFVTLPECITPENPDRYPVSITADDYLQERLREIGLKM
ncbi:isopenicillin N synthase family oxygenase [Novosphingobium flavum]|uniref:2-oxoglutarate-dependent ethylene/succinate-forming enzyme n=1 Tax=Novosphingobium flavum TaxID=1778672 RepID=A0A7X1FQ28_9SPHN|nr:isopenicillin N synthase family oxygenase [Novosphingobium flavum]MBC2664848.1 isopenicillin N synthase family oxygenase [Novosphingobium flavum]